MKHFKYLLFLSILCSLVLFNACSEDEGGAFQFRGSIVAYLFQEGNTGYVAGKVHGLIAATEDQTTDDGAEWGCYGAVVKREVGTAIGTGAQNTIDILADCSEDGIAAKIASDYEVTVDGVTYNDWFLPSKDELNELYKNKEAIGRFAPGYYWSSSEIDSNDAWIQSFVIGLQKFNNDINAFSVRSVRTF